MGYPYENYQRVDISTSDPVRVVIMLYEGAIRYLNQAAKLFDRDNEAATAKLIRALQIVNYLRNCLDFDKGGDVANNLERLYIYMRDVLSEANIQRDKEKIREVVNLMQTILDGWREIWSNQTDTDVDPATISPTSPPAEINLSMMG